MPPGIQYAKRDDPEAYREVLKVLEEDRARPVLQIELVPLAVSLQLVGTDDKGVVQYEVFRYSGREARPEEKPN